MNEPFRKNHEILDDELVLVVDKNTTLTDLTLAEIGLFGHDEFIHIAEKAIEEQIVNMQQKNKNSLFFISFLSDAFVIV